MKRMRDNVYISKLVITPYNLWTL